MLDADKEEIKLLINEALAEWDLGRRERMRVTRAQEETANPVTTKLYLVSLGGHHIAFPDERGRAIFTQAFYARIAMRDKDSYYSQRVEVIAYGDGQRLGEPISLVLSNLSVVGLAEVPETVLGTMYEER
jgi:hypothetical protein